jgi:hypothetical protein
MPDPVEVDAQPLILNNGYFELTAVNLRCLVTHLEVTPEVKQTTVTTLCSETDYPGAVKWHLRVTFAQSFDVGAVYDTLQAALDAYKADGTPAAFIARPYASRPAGPGNPTISGDAIPQPFPILVGDAGALSEAQIDWNLTGEPTVDNAAAPLAARDAA